MKFKAIFQQVHYFGMVAVALIWTGLGPGGAGAESLGIGRALTGAQISFLVDYGDWEAERECSVDAFAFGRATYDMNFSDDGKFTYSLECISHRNELERAKGKGKWSVKGDELCLSGDDKFGYYLQRPEGCWKMRVSQFFFQGDNSAARPEWVFRVKRKDATSHKELLAKLAKVEAVVAKPKPTPVVQPPPKAATISMSEAVAKKLRQLKEFLDQGLISKEDYEWKRRQLVGAL